MKLKYLIGITFFVPLLGLFFINVFATNLSGFVIYSTNFVCLAVLLIVVDVLFIALKRHKLKLDKT